MSYSRPKLSEQEPLVTLDDVLKTYGDSNYSEKAKESAKLFFKELNMLPLGYENPYLFDLNIILGWIYRSGSLHHFSGKVDAHPEFQEGIIETGRRLNLEIKKEKREDKTLIFRDNGVYYGRVLSILGDINTKGTKENRAKKIDYQKKLPDYIKFLTRKYDEFRNEDKKIAQKILSDQCKIIFYSGLEDRLTKEIHINLTSSRDEKIAEKKGREIMDMFEKIYPQIDFKEKNIKKYYNPNRKTHHIKLKIHNENMVNSLKYGLFEFKHNLNYHQFGKRPTYKNN